jgi:hypothetical protein
MSPRSVLFTHLLALPLLVTACDSASRHMEDKAAQPAAIRADAEGPTDVATDDAPATDAATDTDTDRMVIRSARLEVRAEAPAEVIARAIALAEGGGGFVATSDSRGVGDDVDLAHAILRVPSDRFEGLLRALREEGELLSETLGGDDVTDQYVDLAARLRSQRVLEERLLDILGRVESVDDALTVETQLTRVRTEVERLDGQKRSLENRVSFATVDLTVSSPVRHNAQEAETVLSRLDRALDDAGRAFVSVLGGLIRILGVLLPLGLLFIPLGYAVRGALRRRSARTMATVHGPMSVPPAMPQAGPVHPPMPPGH